MKKNKKNINDAYDNTMKKCPHCGTENSINFHAIKRYGKGIEPREVCLGGCNTSIEEIFTEYL
jgi:transcription elongation factor Elf1